MRTALRRKFLLFSFIFSPAVAAESQLPSWLILVPESVPTIFVAEANSYKLHRFDQVDGSLVLTASHSISIGQEGIGKQRTGDRRTPIGTYFVTEQLDTSRMHEKYGPTAFPLDYPNAWDLRLNRTGGGIWVHGVDPRIGARPARDTDGCIALQNEDLLALAGQFVSGVTPVIIADDLESTSTDDLQDLADELEAMIRTWAKSKADGNLHLHLSLYDVGFQRWEMDRDTWTSFSVQTLGAQPISDVTVSDLLILGYPGERDLYLSRFRERIVESGVTREITTRLYWRRDERGALRIIAEDNG